MIRIILPTDLVALLSFEHKVVGNQVVSKCNLSRAHDKPGGVGPIKDQWFSLEGKRKTWVSVKGMTIQGLISVHIRSRNTAWEVDWLVLDPQAAGENVCLELLERLTSEDLGAEVQVVFLRLLADSPLLDVARKAGFRPFSKENLLMSGEVSFLASEWNGDQIELRPRAKGDDHGIFRLYIASLPQSMKEAEGMTQEEWMNRRDRVVAKGKEFVYERDGMVMAWLALSQEGGVGQFEMMAHPQEKHLIEPLAKYAIAKSKKGPVMALVPEYQFGLKRFLSDTAGFESQGEYFQLMKHLAVRVQQPRLVPAKA